LGLRYPGLKTHFTEEFIKDIQHTKTAIATNYSEQLRYFEEEYEKDVKNHREMERQKRQRLLEGTLPIEEEKVIEEKKDTLKTYRNAVDWSNQNHQTDIMQDEIIQLDWTPVAQPTQEELKRKEDQRREQGQRLREINLKKREEKRKKMVKELATLEPYEDNKELQNDSSKLKDLGFSSMEDLLEKIEFLREKLGITAKEEKKEEEKWPFLSIDDSQLDEDQKKTKRIQKMQKSSYLKRMEKRK
jgi:hypothetical protein